VRATTFAAQDADVHRRRFKGKDGRFYQRFFHPTLDAAAQAVAALEGGEAGLVFGSGMGAISTTLMTLLRGGDHAVAHHEIFAQTKTLFLEVLSSYGVTVTFVDARNPGEVAAALKPRTRLVYIETPSNPLLHVIDIAATARAAAGRESRSSWTAPSPPRPSSAPSSTAPRWSSSRGRSTSAATRT